jgi:hypothetical protein
LGFLTLWPARPEGREKSSGKASRNHKILVTSVTKIGGYMEPVQLTMIIARLRRNMSRNSDVMTICDEVWRLMMEKREAKLVVHGRPKKRNRAAYMREYRKRSR